MKPKGKEPHQTPAQVSRRCFLNILWTALGLGALAEFLWLAFSFLRPAEPGGESQANAIVPVGPLASFEPGTVTAFQKGEFYLVRLDDGGLIALSCRCTHLGCTVPWVEKEKKFLCPCHASAFDITGNVINSPAARALDTFPLSIENNIVKVDTGRRIKRSGFNPEQLVYPPKI
ncbi:MAG: Rieske (2Fe-2S) protein [Deltaproteobacteria bacterium]|nr:Rieske (2Fe-2S) protein [Deltaproteobacteria bacterium]